MSAQMCMIHVVHLRDGHSGMLIVVLTMMVVIVVHLVKVIVLCVKCVVVILRRSWVVITVVLQHTKPLDHHNFHCYSHA